MSQVQQEFDANPLWSHAADLRRHLDALPDDLPDPSALDLIGRLWWLSNLLDAYKSQLDPVATPIHVLGQAGSTLANVNSSLINYTNQPQAWQSYLVSAAGQYTDQTLAFLYTLPPLSQGEATKAVREAVKEMQDVSARMITHLWQEVRKLEAAISEQQVRVNEVSTEHEQRTAAVANQAEMRLRELEQAVARGDSRLTEQATRLDTAITNQQATFDAQQTDRADKMAKEILAFQERGRDAFLTLEAETQDIRLNQEKHGETVLNKLHHLLEQASGIVEATGRRAITTEYGEHAQKERQSGFWWSVVAVILALSGFAFIVFEIIRIGDVTPSWQATIFKITGSLALLGVAGYAGKQASEHRAEERTAKRTQLDINAVEPFLSRLPEDKQVALRAEIADRVFARPPQHANGQAVNLDAGGIASLVDAIRQLNGGGKGP